MHIIKAWDTKQTISIKDTKSIEQKYLKEVGTSSFAGLDLAKAEVLFWSITRDFKAGKLSSDEFSVFGFRIFHTIGKKFPKSDLFQATLFASELSFAMREPAAYGNLTLYLRNIDRFLEKYKHTISKK